MQHPIHNISSERARRGNGVFSGRSGRSGSSGSSGRSGAAGRISSRISY